MKYLYSGDSLIGSSPNSFKVNVVPHIGDVYTTTESTSTPLEYEVTDYFNKPQNNISVIINSSSETILKTTTNGRVTYNDVGSFKVNSPSLDIHKDIWVCPVDTGLNHVIGTWDALNYHRLADQGKSVCLQTMGKGTVTSTKTYYAPNGMSITAKGGIFGCIGLYKITWFDKDKKLIKTEEWDSFKSGDSDERFYVPAGAAYVKYKVGCKSTGKAKPETDYLPAGNAIIFYEGLAGTENVHIAAQNANGFEVLRESYKC